LTYAYTNVYSTLNMHVMLLLLSLAGIASAIWEFQLPSPPAVTPKNGGPSLLSSGGTGPPRLFSLAAAAADDPVPPAYLPIPSWDEWYRAPSGWEATTPGTVLRIRRNAYQVRPFPFANVAQVFQVLFRSTDSQKNPSWGVTTVFIPVSKGGAPYANSSSSSSSLSGGSNKTQPILSYQLPYDTACLDASPSFGLQFGEPYGEIAVALARGWWVSVPDYEGPLASYGANIVAGYTTLDSARAVVAAAHSEFNLTKTRIALWGYSNGASATEAAVEFAGAGGYADGFEIAGAAIGGLAPNVGGSGPLLSHTQVAGLLVQGLIGVTSQYPKQRAYLISRLYPSGPYNATEFFWGSLMSGWQSLLYYAYVDIFAYFIGGKADLDVPEMVDMFVREGTLGVWGTPKTKLFIYHAVEDDMTPVGDTDKLVEHHCAQGANILYHRNHWGGHNDELANGRQRAFNFLGDVLDGTNTLAAPQTGCLTVNLTWMHPPGFPFN